MMRAFLGKAPLLKRFALERVYEHDARNDCRPKKQILFEHGVISEKLLKRQNGIQSVAVE